MKSITDEASGSASLDGRFKKSGSARNNEIVEEEEVASFVNEEEEEEDEVTSCVSDLDLTSSSNTTHHAFCPAESKAVFCLKLTVLAVLVSTALSVALAVYFYTSNSETEEFEEHFQDRVDKVFDSYLRQIDRTLGIADSFVLGLVSYANHTNQKWPFVTLPDFGKRLAKIRTLAKGTVVSTFLLVTLEQREQWQNYTVQHDEWVQEGLEVQASDARYHGPYNGSIVSEHETNGEIHDNYGPSQGPGPFLPQWQTAPVGSKYAPYNWDGASYDILASALPELFESRRVVMSKAFNLPDLDDPVSIAATEFSTAWVKDYISLDEDPTEPASDLFYPIIATDDDDGGGNSGDKVVGVISICFFFRKFIENILPQGSDGIILVFDNTCGQTFTYRLDGPQATYLGRGDLHDTKYDYLGTSTDLVQLFNLQAHDDSYTGLPLSQQQCSYLLSVYPSSDTKNEFTTNNPKTFTVVAILIFGFTSAIFLMYDRLVERRQQKVMRTAVQSTAEVSLLEDKIKERTRTLQDTNERLKEANRIILEASAAQLQHFACMSHEIRTPLNCIIGLSSLLQESDLNPIQAESMEMIVSSSDLLLTVVNDVLDYSKLESGNVDVEIRQCSLQETLNSVVRAIEAKAVSKEVAFYTFYDARICDVIHTDGRRLQQILYNLLGNAIKFSEEGGAVELHISLCAPFSSIDDENSYSPSPDKITRLTNEKEGEEREVLRFTVKDYGQGIAKKDFETIFEPFRQAGTETEAVYGGTGLGLPITAKLVQGLGGLVSVKSEEGHWSEFSVDLPFSETPADIEGISSGLKIATFLLVSDEPKITDQVSGMFRQFNVEFATFCNMQQLEAWIGVDGNLSRERSYICVVQANLHDRLIYKGLSTSAKAVLVIFGPKQIVEEDAIGRYRSLVRVLPSLLMKCMGAHLEATEPVSQASTGLLNVGVATDANIVLYQELRVLVAEDNAINQKVLLRILNRLGIKNVVVVDNGQKAVDREAAEPFDVVLMDMQMPLMDGVEACEIIMKRQGGHPKATVAFVTAHASVEFETECLKAGASDFISKPFNIRDLERCLQKLHAAQKPEVEAT
jgi:signal transduction histidine kinase/ActR/RegA family two-component response regulator